MLGGVEVVPQALYDQLRAGERALHRELLVEQHPDEQRERVSLNSASASGSCARQSLVTGES